MAKIRSIKTLVVDSSTLCCNFVNTVSSWKSEDNYEYLGTYGNFIEWCVKLDVVEYEKLQMLNQIAKNRYEEAVVALSRVKEIRKTLQEIISAVAGKDHDQLHLILPPFNALLVEATSRQRLQYQKGKVVLDQVDAPDDLLSPVWKIVLSLADLLTHQDLNRIKECPKCGWVFLDETKNGKRKWCNPKYCGTSDKMMRYNKKRKAFES